MKKRALRVTALLLLIAVVCSCCLAGCHSGKNLAPFEMPESFDETKNYELTFWAKSESNKNQIKVYEDAATAFQKLYPNIKINISFYTDYNVIYQDVITNMSTGTTPDVCITFPDHIATYNTGVNVVVPLNELIANAKYGLGGSELKFDGVKKDEIAPEFFSEGYVDGALYQLPFMRSTEALYINKTYVEKLGYTVPDIPTWDFVWEVAEKAMEKDDSGNFKLNGDSVLIPFIYKSTDNMMIQLLWQKGGAYSTDDGKIEIYNDTTSEILKTVAAHAQTGAFSTFKVSGYPANFLNAGQCIFAIDSTAGATWMGSDAPLSDIGEDRTVQFETAVRPVPQCDTSNIKMMSQGPSICIFNKEDPGRVLASWLFAQYLLTNDVQISYSQTEGYLPVTLKAQKSEEYIDYLNTSGSDNETHYSVKIDAVKMLMANQANTFVTPVFNGSASLREASAEMIERVVKSVRRKETVDDAYIEALYKDIPARFHLDGNDIKK